MKTKFVVLLLCFIIVYIIVGYGKVEASLSDSARGNELESTQTTSFSELGMLGITYDGTRYKTNAYMDAAKDIYISVNSMNKIFGVNPEENYKINEVLYANLTSMCKTQGMESYKYDEVLNSVYIWSRIFKSNKATEQTDIERISYYQLGTPSEGTLSYQAFFEILDHAVATVAEDRLNEWKWKENLQAARNSSQTITRYEAALSILYMAVFLGDDYAEFNAEWQTYDKFMEETVWSEIEKVYANRDVDSLLKNPYPYNLGGFEKASYVYDGWDAGAVAFRYVVGRISQNSGLTLFDFDYENNSLHLDEKITVKDSMLAVVRLLDSTMDSKKNFMLSSTDNAIVHYDESIITPDLLNFIKDMPDVSDENVPNWHGIIWTGSGEYNATDIDTAIFDKMAQLWSEWGFDSVRYSLPYQVLFSKDGSKASKIAFQKLDQIIASAMKYKLHINICTMSIPGRWTETIGDYEYIGEFDLFLNPDRQKEAESIWNTISTRYADLPNSVLSFTPAWECMNYDLSVGLETEKFTAQDVTKEYMRLIAAIQEAKPDRYVVCELTPNNDALGTVEEFSGIKKITIKLDKDYSEISIHAEGVCVNWCGMLVTLPKEYAVHRWFEPSLYESFWKNGEGWIRKELFQMYQKHLPICVVE